MTLLVALSILSDVEQQAALLLLAKPVTEEQTLVSQVLQEQLNNPSFDRAELRDLRKFLKQPLVGAGVQQLRKALQAYSGTNNATVLLDAVRELHQSHGTIPSLEPDKRKGSRVSRSELKLICYEYVYH